ALPHLLRSCAEARSSTAGAPRLGRGSTRFDPVSETCRLTPRSPLSRRRRMQERMSLSIRSYDGLERVHAHDFHQIVLPVVGAMDIRVGAIRGEIARTNGVMIVRGTPHQGNVLGENRFVVFEVPRNSFLAESAVEHASAAPFFEIDERL